MATLTAVSRARPYGPVADTSKGEDRCVDQEAPHRRRRGGRLGGAGAGVARRNRLRDDRAIDGRPPAASARAQQAALAETGGGKVNAVELDNEKGATYEVEVTTPDGSTVDVRLDDAFHVVAVDSGASVSRQVSPRPARRARERQHTSAPPSGRLRAWAAP